MRFFPMRLFPTLAIPVVMAVMLFDMHPLRASEAPWCAVISSGPQSVYWDCQYRTVEECVPNVLAGNRGTCTQNPRYVGEPGPVKKYKHEAHRNRDVRKY
jgi:hypothetical protein